MTMSEETVHTVKYEPSRNQWKHSDTQISLLYDDTCMYLLTEREGRKGKCLARAGHDVQNERSGACASRLGAKYFPFRPDLTQSLFILSFFLLLVPSSLGYTAF